MKFLLCISLSSFCFSSQAQLNPLPAVAKNLEVTAIVVDTTSKEKIEFVSVRLYSAQDSTVVGGALTDSSGRFIIPAVSSGNYYMKLSFIGYQTKQINNLEITDTKKTWDLGRISLRISNTQELGEVKVVGQLDVLKAGIDKKVYNVGEDLNNQGGNASEVLNNVPSVDVDQDGNVSLRGDGNVIILIDGRPSSMSASAGKNFLNSLPSNSIERIEVVTNPSAKYDPDGTSGIINIVLKKNKLKGVNGSINATAATGNLFNGGISLNVRNNKLNAFGSYNANYREGYRNFFGELEQTSSNNNVSRLSQSRPGTDLRYGQNIRLGFDYAINDQHSFGVNGNYAPSIQDRYGLLENELMVNNSVQRRWDRISIEPSQEMNLDLGAFYKWQFKKDKGEFTFDYKLSDGEEKRQGYFFEKYYIESGNPAMKNVLMQRLNNTEKNKVQNFQADYTRLIPERNMRIESGTKASVRIQDLDTYSEAYDYSVDFWKGDTLANFLYNYSENIYASYFILGQQLKKWKYQVGVRGEYAQQIPYLISTNERIVNDYMNLFPSAHLKYAVTDKKEWGLSYSRRINRANAWQLNPFTNYSDPNNLRTGNPYLKPEYINSLDLGYSIEGKKYSITSSLFYRYTTDVIQRVKIFFPNNTSAVTQANIDESQSYGLELVLNYKPTKWWKNTLSINSDRIEYIDRSGETNFNNTGYNFSLKYSGTVDFWKKTASAQVNVRHNAPRITVQGKVLPRSAVDLSAEKKMLKDNKLSVGLRLTDVFNTQGFQYDFEQVGVRQKGEYKWLTRRLYVTLTYNFGKLEISKKGGGQSENGGGGGFDF